ncbi:hypothetical protein [Brevibacterium zhoupengii]|uniref:hypothetical protein n=1 Tax=Brevibacterium zhoupengii TaxID=2898795 RepID=UPI001E2E2479|nr:hypothetical protein [Brevibacterium zhoupengii]
MPKTFLATLVATAFFITGCAGVPATTAGAEVEPAAETETTEASAEEFASIIAEGRRDVDEWLETWDENYCSPIGVGDGTDIMACEISLISGGLIADTKVIEMDSATKEDSLVYIGEPPESIAIIWQSTLDAATAASEAGEAVPDDCTTADDCTSKVMEFTMAMEDLQGKYDAWEPYM